MERPFRASPPSSSNSSSIDALRRQDLRGRPPPFPVGDRLGRPPPAPPPPGPNTGGGARPCIFRAPLRMPFPPCQLAGACGPLDGCCRTGAYREDVREEEVAFRADEDGGWFLMASRIELTATRLLDDQFCNSQQLQKTHLQSRFQFISQQ